MKLLTLKMKLAEAMKTHNKLTIVIYILCGLIGYSCGQYVSKHTYWKGYAEGVAQTEQCLDHWGKMKHDGWNFYCID